MATLNMRLLALEQRRNASRYYSGLGHFYDTMGSLETVGGGNALIERLDAGTATPADREAISAVPGGEQSVHPLMAAMDRFYP